MSALEQLMNTGFAGKVFPPTLMFRSSFSVVDALRCTDIVNYKFHSNVRDFKMSENEGIIIIEAQCCL